MDARSPVQGNGQGQALFRIRAADPVATAGDGHFSAGKQGNRPCAWSQPVLCFKRKACVVSHDVSCLALQRMSSSWTSTPSPVARSAAATRDWAGAAMIRLVTRA
jgi:hypothetical protein